MTDNTTPIPAEVREKFKREARHEWPSENGQQAWIVASEKRWREMQEVIKENLQLKDQLLMYAGSSISNNAVINKIEEK